MTTNIQVNNDSAESLSHAETIQKKDLQRANSLQEKSKPLVNHIYTADPSAHVFEGKIYVYPSHDIETDNAINDNGDHFAMEDYHVLSLDSKDFSATDHGVALSIDDVPWASKQMWAPDAAHKNGTYYFYFPARDEEGIFRIGAASSTSPTGPFKAEPDYIQGTFSIDPAVFEDDDGRSWDILAKDTCDHKGYPTAGYDSEAAVLGYFSEKGERMDNKMHDRNK